VVADGHWIRWHGAYEDPNSSLSRRLAVVQERLRRALDDAPEGPIRVLSLCAGQGRDVIGVLTDHHRRGDVLARLVERDPELARHARAAAHAAGLRAVEVVEGDASSTSSCLGAVPAEIILVCGVFGNITDADIHRTVRFLPSLSAPGATVIWTRHTRAPDLTPTIRAWFEEAGFEEIAFEVGQESGFGVGANRLITTPRPFRDERRMFTFVGDGADAHL
jgi:Putative methyltransferase